ncbi:MAG: hypothetical protein HC905_05675 [Bacteroidales bacterium]|nr:hypothetical protein [Bacteroidales bacterium]
MPITAINSNLADYILSPGKIGEELVRIADRPKFSLQEDESEDSKNENHFNQILDLIYKASGIDFKQYKPATLIRRIEKRITIRQLLNLKDYLIFLKSNPKEQELLFNDFLIGVTAFFRDPLAFNEIKETVFPEIFTPDRQKESVRFWVVACSTGEEAYSLAIMIDEYLKERSLSFDFKIFATDADAKSIQHAGLGRYPVNLVSDISSERLEKYFIKTGTHLEIVKTIRERIVFSNHNILRDPPFIRMDFISCRNMLIYMKSKVQRKIMLSLQFGLKLNGFLFLGNSENLGDVQSQFKIIDAKWRIYQNISTIRILPTQLQSDGKISSYNLSHPFL